MFAVGAIISRFLRSSSRAFTEDAELKRQLASLSDVHAAHGYDFVGHVPMWLDEQFRVAKERWRA
jgi:hypothetical protein